MGNVFISYASEDRDIAQRLASAIEAQGFDVWWDRELVAGNTFADVIEQRLDQAAAVVVIWSEHSRRSYWVRDEAAVGRDRNRLIPVSVDETAPPIGFRQIQTANLVGWAGEADRRLETLWPSLASLAGRTATASPPPAETTAPPPKSRTIVSGVNAEPNNRSMHDIMKGEKRQRGFLRTFWLTSFILSGVMSAAYALLDYFAPEDEFSLTEEVIFSFLLIGIGLVVGRFLIVIGRRLSKRKSVKYFDQPTLICLGVTLLLAVGLMTVGDTSGAADVALGFVSIGFLFPLLALVSVPIGLVKGLSRKTFEDGR